MITISTTARKLLLAGLVATALPVGAQAQTVSWADWVPAGPLTPPNTVNGSLNFLGTPVGITFSGPYSFLISDCSGGNYWTPPATFTGVGVDNAPGGCDLIGIGDGSVKTVSFSSAVVDPLIAFVSWNNQPQAGVPFSGMNGATAFDPTIEIVQNGCGVYGCGTMSATGNVLLASGEVHGTIRLKGTFTSLSFTDGSEYWHGLTFGATDIAPTATVPEPGTWALLATGLVAIGGIARRRRTS